MITSHTEQQDRSLHHLNHLTGLAMTTVLSLLCAKNWWWDSGEESYMRFHEDGTGEVSQSHLVPFHRFNLTSQAGRSLRALLVHCSPFQLETARSSFFKQ